MNPAARRRAVGLRLVLAWAALFPSATLLAGENVDGTASQLVSAAIRWADRSVAYDGSYRALDYPGGDVPESLGVCTDLVIRSYRAIGVDLQVEVHEDMKAAFSTYPKHRGQSRPDPNIDHRRVLNLQVFLRRQRAALEISGAATDYRTGDLVTWELPGGCPHIGIVTNLFNADSTRPLMIHHVDLAPRVEDVLFEYPITGHFRYLPEGRAENIPSR